MFLNFLKFSTGLLLAFLVVGHWLLHMKEPVFM